MSTSLGDAAVDFERLRPRLFGVAYRMLSSRAEAEDVVQDAWLRWQAYDRESVIDPAGFLVTTTTRLAINAMQSARVRREAYVGPWLPEPIDTAADPSVGAERAEAVELGMLMLLDTLTPKERAAYVLREAFDYPYDRIADIVGVTEDNARQLVSRAGKRVSSGRRGGTTSVDRGDLLEAFLRAAQAGDFEQLERMLADDVVSYSDGGGARRAARRPIEGRARVAGAVAKFPASFWSGTTHRLVVANAQPAILVTRGDDVVVLLALETGDGERIDRILWVLNPAKLGDFHA